MNIQINCNDLKETIQDEIRDIARTEVAGETTQEEADNLNMHLDEIITERVEGKLLSMNNDGKFIFNV